MDTIDVTTFDLPARGGGATFVRRWDTGAMRPRAVIVIAHGVSEHGERYDRIARSFAERGFVTYASDHRGHGLTAKGKLGDAGSEGWEGILDDVGRVLERARADHPGLPAFILGHSMGSIVAQRFIALHAKELAGAILSGTPLKLADPQLIAAARAAAENEPEQPATLFVSMFSGFNAPFEAVTGFEWLSRDTDEVRKYVDDPMSGNPLTNATLADFLPGWAQASSAENRALVATSLPILIVSGDRDPAGTNGEAPKELADAYRANGSRDVTLRLYAQARHEVFNETNRDEVTNDLIGWLDAHVLTNA